MTVPTDCDQRDERLGWMGDANLSGDSIALNFNALSFLRFYLQLIAEEVGADGSLTDVVPFYRYGGRPGDVSWTEAFANLLTVCYRTYGDLGPTKVAFDKLVAQVQNVQQQASGGLDSMHTPYGDWCPPPAKQGKGQGPKPSPAYTSAFSYLSMVSQASTLANAVGNHTQARHFAAMRKKLDADFNAAFLVENATYDSKIGGDGFQTAQALALNLGVSPNVDRTRALLVQSLSENKGHYTTGIIGFKSLLPELYAAGEQDTALAILMQTDYPSIGYNFANGKEEATENLWELPDADMEGVGMNSRNHHMWSSYSAYLVQHVGGVEIDAASGAATLRPAHQAGLSSARVRMDAPGGVVELSWRQVGGVHVDKVAKGDALRLSCGPDGGSIANVLFASYGTPRLEGTPMRMIQDDICHATNSSNIIEGECIRRESCIVSSSLFSDYLTDACKEDAQKRLWAAVACTEEMAIQVNASIPAGIPRTYLQLPAHRFAGAVDVFEGERLIYTEKGYRERLLEKHGILSVHRGSTIGIIVVEVSGAGLYSFTMRSVQRQ